MFAHSLPTPDRARWERLPDHLLAVGRRAAAFAEVFSAGKLALAAGLLHDIGKSSVEYQAYIGGGRPTGPDHSTAGARVAVAEYGPDLGRLLAFTVACHHSGLMDGSGDEGRGRSLNERLDTSYAIPAYDAWPKCVQDLPTASDVRTARAPRPHPDYPGFEVAFFIRMLASCLVDADFLETERFYVEADGKPVPARGATVDVQHLQRLRSHMAGLRRNDGRVNIIRSEILDHALRKAASAPGLFTLTVPTGGGKTLASLSFALEHALRHGLRRVIYVIPFTSIIEQTARVFRDEVGLGEAVLEHHSNFDWEWAPQSADEERHGADGLAKLRRDVENWDAAIVVTTAVQFFESLFAARKTQLRKLHNIAKSVIVLDEVQTLPVHLLRPCMAAVDELARNFGCTVVLCTATQPALRQGDSALPRRGPAAEAPGFDIGEERELAPRPRHIYAVLKRVAVEWRRTPVSDTEIANQFGAQEQMLCIVNTRAHAHALFDAISHLPGARHLTTLMCPRHRRDVLASVKGDLQRGRPVRVVATSLIEAGVDVDFPEVWRAAAGLDSIAQAAGRCNREGRRRQGRTVVFEPDGRRVPPFVNTFYQAARRVLRANGDPLALDAVCQYFRELYFERGYDALDAPRLNGESYPIIPAIDESRRGLEFPFSRIAHAFRLIDEVMMPVLIPLDEVARRALDGLRHAAVPPASALRQLQQYVVPIPRGVRQAMMASGAVQPIQPGIYGDRFLVLANESLYDQSRGLRLEDPTWRSSEDNVW